MHKPLQLGIWNTARTRLLILVLLVAMPVLGLQIAGAWVDLRRDINAQKLGSLQNIHHARSDFETLLKDTRAVFTDLVQIPGMRNPDNCTKVFTGLRFAYEHLAPEISNLGLADSQGDIYCAINPLQAMTNIATQPDFKAAIQTLDLALGAYRINPLSGKPTMSVSYPVLSSEGEVQTVIFAVFETQWLENWQSEVVLPDGTAVTLISTDGAVLWRTVSGENVPVNGLKAEGAKWFSALQGGERVVEARAFDGIHRLHTLVSLQDTASLLLGYPVSELYAEAYKNLSWKLALLVLVVAAGVGLAMWGSEMMFLRPLKSLLGVVQRVQGGDLGARVSELNGLGELAELAQSFDRMTEALQRREAQRRQLEERFRAAFESSAVGIGMLGLDGSILAVNPAVCKMSGYTEEELKQRNDRQNVYPEDLEVGQEMFAEVLAGERSYYRVEKRYVRKNNSVFWTRLTISLVRNEEGQPAYLVGMIEDIDEVKRKSAALIESEARFRTMFNTAAVGIGLMGLDRRVIDANPALCQMYGYTREELIGKTNDLVAYPADISRAKHQMQGLLDGMYDSFFDERRYIRKNGEVFWANITMSLVRDDHQKPLYIVGIVTDIDARKKAQETLRESEARFKAMFDNAAIGISLVCPDRGLLAANTAVLKMIGYSEAELKELHALELTYPEDADVDKIELGEILEGKRQAYQVEKRILHKDGHPHWIRQTVSSVREPGGKLLYLVVIAEDIDQQKIAIEELRESEARFKAMYDNTSVGMMMISLEGNIIRMNQASGRMSGYSLDELVDTHLSRLSHPEDSEIGKEQFLELASGRILGFQIEKRIMRKDGTFFWGRLTNSSVPKADGCPEYLVAMIEDITEQKISAERLAAQEAEYRRRLEERIAQRTAELNLANERLRERAAEEAVLAERTRLARELHDAVTQTLFSTTLIAEVLPDLFEIDTAEAKRRLEELRLLTRGALAEMRTLLVELRPNALVEVPLPALLRQLVDAKTGQAHINIQLSAEGERKLPADVQVGFYRIAQEALNNVVKHGKASQAVMTLRLGDEVRLTVADNGQGFDPLTVTADHLGLKIMRERAEAISAKFSIYSEPDEGTQISVVWQ